MNVKLINMPFANLASPSIALTQLKAVLDQAFRDEISVETIYLNHDFARYLGFDLYQFLTGSIESHNSGLGDWLFRQAAFPELPDNAVAYFRRYYPHKTPRNEAFQTALLTKRAGLEQLMDSLIVKYALDEADVVGFTSMFMQNTASLSLSRRLKAGNPRVVTIMGGANCETPMGQQIVKNAPQIDYVFSGPGLKTLPEFVGYLMRGESEKCHGIKGVFSKKNYAFQGGPNAIGDELSIDIPIDLDYEPFLKLLEENFPDQEVKPILLFETSRGCWWGERAHCTFCGLNGESMAYRAMEPNLALNLFESLFQYSGRVSRLEAVDNILPKNYLRDVLPRINTPPDMSIFYEVKADLEESDIQVLSRARVKEIQPGIESLATSTLKLMKKGTSAFQNLRLLKNCAVLGIHPVWNLLIGFPGEEEDVYQKYVADIPTLVHLPPPSAVFPVRFDRYSPYFTQAREYNLQLQPLDFYAFIYPFSKDEVANLAYYFADNNIRAKYVVTMVKWIGKIKEKVDPWIARWASREAPAPVLCFAEGAHGVHPAICDSRSGKVVEYEISHTAKQLLDLLSRPKRTEDISKELKHLAAFDVEAELKELRGRGLIFHENGRYLSLVLDSPAQ